MEKHLTLVPAGLAIVLGLVLQSPLVLFGLIMLIPALQARALQSRARVVWTILAGVWSLVAATTLIDMRQNIGTFWDMVPQEEPIVAVLLAGIFTGISMVVVALIRR